MMMRVKMSGLLQHLLLVFFLSAAQAQTSPSAGNATAQQNTTSDHVTSSSQFTSTGQMMSTSTGPGVTTALPVNFQAPQIFYPFGSALGDTQRFSNYYVNDESYAAVSLSRPFTYFGRNYSTIYVQSNGLITLNQPTPASGPNYFPVRGTEDYIAPLLTDMDDYGLGRFFYQEYTSGSVLTRASSDINLYFPLSSFNASWLFVVTWDFSETFDMNVFLQHSAPGNLFQAVLISDGSSSFLLFNYGNCSVAQESVEAGFDTMTPGVFFFIPDSTVQSYIPYLKDTTNVNVAGRWAFNVTEGAVATLPTTSPVPTTTPTPPPTSTSTTSTTTAAPDTFYWFGPAAGDAQVLVNGTGSFSTFDLSTPFTYFGRLYHNIYINSNGLLTFNSTLLQSNLIPIPSGGSNDFIAPLWMNLNYFGYGFYYYQQYTSGSVLSRATHDINQYFPNISFSASSVFVVTWDHYIILQHAIPTIQVQAVLISDGFYSFILLNYGNCAATLVSTEAGFDTVGSTNYFLIPGSINGTNLPNFQFTSNVNVPGRWAFSLTDVSKVNLLGVQLTASTFVDLTQTGNAETLLQSIKQELMSYGVTDFELNIRNITRIKP